MHMFFLGGGSAGRLPDSCADADTSNSEQGCCPREPEGVGAHPVLVVPACERGPTQNGLKVVPRQRATAGTDEKLFMVRLSPEACRGVCLVAGERGDGTESAEWSGVAWVSSRCIICVGLCHSRSPGRNESPGSCHALD